MARIYERIKDEVGAWDGVEVLDHDMGGVEFKVGRVELGHIHGDRLADLPFPKKVHDELIEAGRAQPHHVLPETGWVSRFIEDESEVDEVVALFRINYDRVTARGGLGRTAEKERGGLGRTAEKERGGLGRTAEKERKQERKQPAS